jgi:hypothetical protein
MTLPPFSKFLPICLTMRDSTERQTFAWLGSCMAIPPLTEAKGDRHDITLFFTSCETIVSTFLSFQDNQMPGFPKKIGCGSNHGTKIIFA